MERPERSVDDHWASVVEEDQHLRYQKRITTVATVCGVAGALVGVALLVVLLTGGRTDGLGRMVFTPVAFAGGGYMFGMALTCLFAPRAFLTGPIGRPWMKKIGTKSVTVARIACLIFGLMGTSIAAGIALLLLLPRG